MKIFFSSLIIFLILASSALATTSHPKMEEVASIFVQNKVDVLCYKKGEKNNPDDLGAWGYVYPWIDEINLNQDVCEGLLGIIENDPSVDRWKKGIGVLVLVHESYHLRKNLGNRGNEAATECRAIRHFKYAVQMLGGTKKLADDLMSVALYYHWRLVARYKEYYKKNCDVPKLGNY